MYFVLMNKHTFLTQTGKVQIWCDDIWKTTKVEKQNFWKYDWANSSPLRADAEVKYDKVWTRYGDLQE